MNFEHVIHEEGASIDPRIEWRLEKSGNALFLEARQAGSASWYNIVMVCKDGTLTLCDGANVAGLPNNKSWHAKVRANGAILN